MNDSHDHAKKKFKLGMLIGLSNNVLCHGNRAALMQTRFDLEFILLPSCNYNYFLFAEIKMCARVL